MDPSGSKVLVSVHVVPAPETTETLIGCVTGSSPAPQLTALSAHRLSNESTFTRWAHPLEPASIRSAPSATARAVGSLHMLTEQGLPEVYLLLSQTSGEPGQSWVRLRVPGRPNGRTGWVPRSDLGGFHETDMALRVNISLLRATLFRDGHAIWSAPVGAGKPSTPTPTGRFWVRELLSVPGETLYGPYAFGTSDYSVLTEWPAGGVVGIHGTNEPELIPGRPSNGCIRMRNADITYLAHHLPIGAPVHIVG
jgi:hypothetical protein